MSSEITSKNPEVLEASQEATRGGRFYRPNVDIIETKDALLLKADMPGTSVERVSLNYDKGTLTLHAAVPQRQEEGQHYLLQEYGVADFHREFVINEDIDPQKIAASYKDGLLTVTLPKTEAARPRRIEVKVC